MFICVHINMNRNNGLLIVDARGKTPLNMCLSLSEEDTGRCEPLVSLIAISEPYQI